jgi:hypothetical protein
MSALSWWCPADIGGLVMGFFGDIEKADIEASKLGVDSLIEFLQLLAELPLDEQILWLAQKRHQQVDERCSELLPARVVRSLGASNISSRFPCEVVFDDQLEVRGEDVFCFCVPSGYVAHPLVKRLRKAIPTRVKLYDARYGIEEAGRTGIVFDRIVREP